MTSLLNSTPICLLLFGTLTGYLVQKNGVYRQYDGLINILSYQLGTKGGKRFCKNAGKESGCEIAALTLTCEAVGQNSNTTFSANT